MFIFSYLDLYTLVLRTNTRLRDVPEGQWQSQCQRDNTNCGNGWCPHKASQQAHLDQMLPVVTLAILVWLFHKLTIVSRGIYSLKFVVTEQYTNCLKRAIIDFRHFLIGTHSFDKVWLLNMFILKFFLLFPNRPTSEIPNCFNSSLLNLVIFESSYAKLSWKERIKQTWIILHLWYTWETFKLLVKNANF